MNGIFRARCNIYISCLCYDVSVRLFVRLTVTEVHWRIIANLGFKFRFRFTAHCSRGACQEEGMQRYAKRGICRRRVSVCLSVCLSVTLWYCIKTAKRRITQIMPHDSSGNLVRSFVSSGAAVDCWQSFDVPSATASAEA